jgi:hypothetical protein
VVSVALINTLGSKLSQYNNVISSEFETAIIVPVYYEFGETL